MVRGSEPSEESKDPLPADAETSTQGIPTLLSVSWWKLLEEPVVGSEFTGSFDCVVVRYAHGNSAQDDND